MSDLSQADPLALSGAFGAADRLVLDRILIKAGSVADADVEAVVTELNAASSALNAAVTPAP